MQNIEDIAEDILRREGGYVNDPDDPGGATNFGVTVHTLRRLGVDLNDDGVVDSRDVKALSSTTARDILLKQYFYAPRISHLPECLHASVFDMYVNAGPNAVKLLQGLLVRMGYHLVVDGVIGPKTEEIAKRAVVAASDHIVDAYGIERRNFYYRLADLRPSSRKFARRRDGGKGGWIRRAEEFISPKYQLSETEHRDRTSTWD